jgi:hypothetical protein
MRATPSRALLALILAAGFSGLACAADAPAPAASQPENAVPAAFAAPFNAAQDLLKAGNGAAALAKLKELETLVPNLTPYEQYLILHVRAPAEYATNDPASAAADYETLLSSSFLGANDRLPLLKARASILYSSEQYAKASVAIQRYLDAGGDDAQLRDLLPQTFYLAKDYTNAAKAYKTQVDATYAAGKVPTEKTLRLLASSYSQANDDTGYLAVLDHLAVSYPKADYWKELVSRALHSEKMSDRVYVDSYRLKAAVYGDVADSDRLTYATLAMRAGFPAEAKRVLDDGFAKKAFTGADLGDATKLREQANRGAAQDKAQRAASESAAKAAKDGNALVNQGFLETLEGDAPSGVALMEQGIAKDTLKFPDEAKLHLGQAQLRAGRTADAVATFKGVTGGGGLSSMAHVWMLFAQSQLQGAAAPVASASAATK